MKHRSLGFYLAVVLSFATVSPFYGQVGNNNPSGASGIFNGQIHTGCSYDPWTGNAVRTVTDITVASAVGEYPLALVRTANSRAPSTTGVFGWDGGWNHNYNWTMEDSPVTYTQNFQPVKYTVNFPDGRVETFHAVTWDTVYRVRPGADTPPQSTSAGVRERFLQLNLNNMYAYLILPDGGAVEFQAQQYYDPAYGRYWYKYHVTGIYDPHGLKTTIDSEVVGTIRRITRVTEPAGRYLQFTYDPNARRLITQITEYINGVAGRSVQYNYTYGWLSSVVYYGNSAWTATYQYTGSNIGGDLPLLLYTCDDPMYPGPMHKIAYSYRTADNFTGNHPVYGQISSENYYDGTNVGVAVSTLTVPSATTRTETRADSKTRTFTYNGSGYLTSCTDFYNHSASQGYDSYKYINYVTDRNGNRTDYTNDSITGNVRQVQFPLTSDTPGQGNTRPTINYTYTNSYYLQTVQGENSQTTTIRRDGNNRVYEIDYPDGGQETFGYDAGHFYQLNSHRMVTGGTETFSYDGSSRLQYYSDPYHSNPGNPSFTYSYDGLDRVSGIVDNLSQATNFGYNDRGQVTLTTLPYLNGQRYTISNDYNSDGTLHKRTDELGHFTTYTYDDYRRLASVTPPVRGNGDTQTHITNFYYGTNPSANPSDYKYTDSNVTWVVLPSGNQTKTVYDDDRRKQLVTVGYGTGDAATTSYGYDNVSNLTSITYPLNHSNTTIVPDERNRPKSISVLSHSTTFTYDTAGHRKSISRPNGQVITYDMFDEMNRVTQETATQSPEPTAITKYTYYRPSDGQNPPVGLLKTMQDPYLVANNSSASYSYSYDSMGRKTRLAYPGSGSEGWSYDTLGRLQTFTNRIGNVQTFSYDQLNRMTGFTWNDNLTPSVSFGYDAASRLTTVNNAKANITRAYYNDNLLYTETESITGAQSKTVTYTYNGDGKRANISYPDYQAFAYGYTGRNQLRFVGPWATYAYNTAGDLITRTITPNNTSSSYSPDQYDRIISITHSLANNNNRTVSYGYDPNSDNRLWDKRVMSNGRSPEYNKGEVFSYDLTDQATVAKLDILNPDTTAAGSQTIFYDANGNRTTFQPYGTSDTYLTNNLNQYSSRNSNNAVYNADGNMTQSPDPVGSRLTPAYDAQNRLLNASKGGGGAVSFTFDGLNRQVSRTVNGTTTYNVWDGWNLIEEYQSGGTVTAKYVYGPGGLIKELVNNRYYFQDGSGSTSHVTDNSGNLLEWYRYDLQGTPVFYDANDNQLSASNYSVRRLFTGQQWYQEVGLYDLRNRFYSPDLGRFLQPDPIDFRGDATNLYRYCGNNPLIYADPSGLWTFQIGLSITLQGGPFAVSGSGGLAFDNHGNIGGYTAAGPGVGFGADAGAAISLAGSNADTIYGLRGWYSNAASGGGVVGQGGVESFGGKDAITNKPVLGFGVAGGLGAGGGAFAGATYTNIYGLWPPSNKSDAFPPPGGTTDVDPNICPECATVERVVVTGTPVDEQGGSSPRWSLFTPQYAPYAPSLLNYTGPGITSLSNPFGSWGPSSGGPIQGSIFGPGNFYSGLDPIAGFLSITIGEGFGAGEPLFPGCFVAGTPVLMADGSEKPIESIQVGEEVLAWNEETKTVFPSKIVAALHHDEKMQTLFDIELEDGRTFTVNNDHPMYVVEDGDFKFTNELAARFAKGEPIKFQDNKNQPVNIASLRMRRQRCKVYNLHVEGQGKNGHTYYASGILVHNSRAGNMWK